MVKSTIPPGGGRRRRTKVRGRKGPAIEEKADEVPETLLPAAGGASNDGIVDKRTLCVDALADGFVQSFVDFFYLTHRPDPTPDPLGENQGSHTCAPFTSMNHQCPALHTPTRHARSRRLSLPTRPRDPGERGRHGLHQGSPRAGRGTVL